MGAMFALTLLAAPAAAQKVPAFGFEDARRVADAAVERARAGGKAIAVAVVNREGRVLVALRMDGVSYVNLDVAQAKAVTAATLGVPSGAIGQAIDAGKPSLLSVEGLSPIAGGVPIVRGGTPVAGIGVSGGAPEDDEALATAAIQIIPKDR